MNPSVGGWSGGAEIATNPAGIWTVFSDPGPGRTWSVDYWKDGIWQPVPILQGVGYDSGHPNASGWYGAKEAIPMGHSVWFFLGHKGTTGSRIVKVSGAGQVSVYSFPLANWTYLAPNSLIRSGQHLFLVNGNLEQPQFVRSLKQSGHVISVQRSLAGNFGTGTIQGDVVTGDGGDGFWWITGYPNWQLGHWHIGMKAYSMQKVPYFGRSQAVTILPKPNGVWLTFTCLQDQCQDPPPAHLLDFNDVTGKWQGATLPSDITLMPQATADGTLWWPLSRGVVWATDLGVRI